MRVSESERLDVFVRKGGKTVGRKANITSIIYFLSISHLFSVYQSEFRFL